MCRNIKTLHNFKPPATDEEIRASALQFVRKLSGFTKPSKANELAFNRAVEKVTAHAHELLEVSRILRARPMNSIAFGRRSVMAFPKRRVWGFWLAMFVTQAARFNWSIW